MPHLLDTTMFWTTAGGGVRRYLEAKNAFATGARWQHSVATPMLDGIGTVRVPSVPLPASGGYRLPWRRGAAARVLRSQAPDLIEAGDPYRLAWSALDAAQSLGIPALAFCHSNLERLAASIGGDRTGTAAARLGAATPATCTSSSTWCWHRVLRCALICVIGVCRGCSAGR